MKGFWQSKAPFRFKKIVYRSKVITAGLSGLETYVLSRNGEKVLNTVLKSGNRRSHKGSSGALFLASCRPPTKWRTFGRVSGDAGAAGTGIQTAVARGGFSRGGFGIWLKIGRFRGLGGPGVLSNHPSRWGVSPPTSLDGFKATRGSPDPENDRFSAKSKTTHC